MNNLTYILYTPCTIKSDLRRIVSCSNIYQQTIRKYSEVSRYLPRKDEKQGEEEQEIDSVRLLESWKGKVLELVELLFYLGRCSVEIEWG